MQEPHGPQAGDKPKEYVMPPESRIEPELTLPKDLLSEVQRHMQGRRSDFHVEGWKPSLVQRMLGLFDRGRSRD